MTQEKKYESDTFFMRRCLELAVLGSGTVSPNPLVGCVIVHDGSIIGEGYHQQCGSAHAEVNAIGSVEDKELLRQSVLYVNLEPCNHQGRTPACTDLILSMGISKVVIGCRDSHPKVSGSGIERLRHQGVEVVEGVLEELSRFVNRRFFTFHEKRRPYVILKWAKTIDGFIDILRKPDEDIGIHWITSSKLKVLVHRWRHEEDAILVGARTVLHDDPALTTREWPGKNPVRVVIDRDGILTPSFKVFNSDSDVLYFTMNTDDLSPLASTTTPQLIPPTTQNIPEFILQNLHAHQHLSVIVEGGYEMLQSFIDSGLWDEARVFTGNKRFCSGLKAPSISGIPDEQIRFGDDLLEIFYNGKQTLQ